jgi:hypothetical protein
MAPSIAAPVKAGPLPTIIVPTITPPVPNEDLRLLDDVEAAERGAQSFRSNRSRLEAVGQRPAGDQRGRCRQCQTNPPHSSLLEPKLTQLHNTKKLMSCIDANQLMSGNRRRDFFDKYSKISMIIGYLNDCYDTAMTVTLSQFAMSATRHVSRLSSHKGALF